MLPHDDDAVAFHAQDNTPETTAVPDEALVAPVHPACGHPS
jgi:hypothetical protein